MKSKILVLICTVVLSMTAISASAAGKSFCCIFSDSPSYKYEDDNVVITVYNRALWIQNKSNHVIYLDKETSFAYLNDRPTCLFTNASYTNSTSQGSGSTVNLGAVAGAMGVKGSMGSLLSGVNVGSDQTQGSSTTIVEQKIITIAPQSTYKAYSFGQVNELIKESGTATDLPHGGVWRSKYIWVIDPKTKELTKGQKGMTWQYNEYAESPLRLKGVVNYYVDDKAESPIQVTVSNYVSNIVIDEPDLDNAELLAPYKSRDWMAWTWHGSWPQL